MSTLLQVSLIVHVLLGVVGVICFYAVWMTLLKSKPSQLFITRASLMGAVSFVIAWLTSGYYYVVYYGDNVKPIIKAGENAWAHSLFMEYKEHVFLFLPFLAITAYILIIIFKSQVSEDSKLRRSLALLAGLITVLGIIVILSGIIVSGAVR